MKRNLVTLTCPEEDCTRCLSYHILTPRLQELEDDLSEGESLEDAILGLLLQDWQECPYCSRTYEVEIGSSVDRGGCSVEAGP